MHVKGFRILLGLLLVACLVILIAMVTISWWTTEDKQFKAGLWQECYDDKLCVAYGEEFDPSVKKQSNFSFLRTRENAAEIDYHLDVIRGLVGFSIVLLGVDAIIVTVFTCMLKTYATTEIPRVAKIVVALLVLVSGLTSFSGATYATNYKEIFGLDNMVLGGSWVAMLLGGLLTLIIGITFSVMLAYEAVQKRNQPENSEVVRSGFDSVFSSKQSSRKNSKVSTDHSINDYHPYGSLHKFNQIDRSQLDSIDGGRSNGVAFQNIAHSDENSEYRIPDVDDDIRMATPITDLDSDMTIGKLSDFSSSTDVAPTAVLGVVESDDSGGDENE